MAFFRYEPFFPIPRALSDTFVVSCMTASAHDHKRHILSVSLYLYFAARALIYSSLFLSLSYSFPFLSISCSLILTFFSLSRFLYFSSFSLLLYCLSPPSLLTLSLSPSFSLFLTLHLPCYVQRPTIDKDCQWPTSAYWRLAH